MKPLILAAVERAEKAPRENPEIALVLKKGPFSISGVTHLLEMDRREIVHLHGSGGLEKLILIYALDDGLWLITRIVVTLPKPFEPEHAESLAHNVWPAVEAVQPLHVPLVQED